MPTPAQHYIEAERLLEHVKDYASDMAIRMAWYAEAQIHATLATTPTDTYRSAELIAAARAEAVLGGDQ